MSPCLLFRFAAHFVFIKMEDRQLTRADAERFLLETMGARAGITSEEHWQSQLALLLGLESPLPYIGESS